MRVTLFGTALRGRSRVGWVLELAAPAATFSGRGRAFRVSRKAGALLLLLASRRLDASSASSLGSVGLSEIPNLREWAGVRTSASLAAQVRREIKAIHQVCPGMVDAPGGAQLKGPFRLTCVPSVDRRTRQALAEMYAPLDSNDRAFTSESLYSWLEQTEPIWRSFHYFDKAGEALSSSPTFDDTVTLDPLALALASVGSAKRMRELGAYGKAKQALAAAATAAGNEPNLPVRQHLQVMCSLEHAWLSYRTADLDAAERWLASADAIATSGALLRLRGQMLNLRSLVRRSRGLYSASLDDLRHAARLFIAEGDLFHLFAVYHNLACLIAAEAGEEPDSSRRPAMFRQALSYSQRNEAYCRHYGIGHNSVLNKLLQVGLHRELRNANLALQAAGDAERLALDSQNFPDAMRAHRHRVAILLEGRLLREAKEVHDATVNTLHDADLRRQFRRIYEEEWAQRIESRLPADGVAARPGRGRRTRGG